MMDVVEPSAATPTGRVVNHGRHVLLLEQHPDNSYLYAHGACFVMPTTVARLLRGAIAMFNGGFLLNAANDGLDGLLQNAHGNVNGRTEDGCIGEGTNMQRATTTGSGIA